MALELKHVCQDRRPKTSTEAKYFPEKLLCFWSRRSLRQAKNGPLNLLSKTMGTFAISWGRFSFMFETLIQKYQQADCLGYISGVKDDQSWRTK